MNRVALDLGFIQLYWYSIFIFLGILVGTFLIIREARKKKIDEEFITNLIFYTVIFGLIGSRCYYVLFNLDYYIKNPLEIVEVWNGGLAIHGAIIGGLVCMFFYTRKYKVKLLRLLDISVVGLIIGQAIGRWGNFFNGEAHGAVTTLEHLNNLHLPKFVIDGMYINGSYFEPTFLYESIWCLLGFIALLVIRRYKYLKIGQLTGAYLVIYSVGRLFIEGMRTDSLMLGPIRVAQLVSGILIVVGILLILYSRRGGHFNNLYREQEKN